MSDNIESQPDTPEPDVERIWTTVRLKKTTRDRFVEGGRKGESYDDVANRVMDENETLRAYIKRCHAFLLAESPDLYARMQEVQEGAQS
jgi:hypothetical protein